MSKKSQIVKQGFVRKYGRSLESLITSPWKKIKIELNNEGYLSWLRKDGSMHGTICLAVIYEYFTFGSSCRAMPFSPTLPPDGKLDNMFAFPEEPSRGSRIHFFLCNDHHDFRKWISTIYSYFPINSTLPTPASTTSATFSKQQQQQQHGNFTNRQHFMPLNPYAPSPFTSFPVTFHGNGLLGSACTADSTPTSQQPPQHQQQQQQQNLFKYQDKNDDILQLDRQHYLQYNSFPSMQLSQQQQQPRQQQQQHNLYPQQPQFSYQQHQFYPQQPQLRQTGDLVSGDGNLRMNGQQKQSANGKDKFINKFGKFSSGVFSGALMTIGNKSGHVFGGGKWGVTRPWNRRNSWTSCSSSNWDSFSSGSWGSL
ncbi:hypothetical protein HELRODRAFT_194536 [Helobdella robusta]|uniref:PH domain-containing protein n=1 Tax=Helobdella robusta TaxID=6412 RepID=T1FW61_HELRO|nr:hypothetical protein HELRODRAFT_194536 [Helobdella robusta]ESN91130.1 hypothetical protein HELRODRAFT_194536 [Helobdella robusta]